MDKLCVDKVYVSKLCGDKLCVSYYVCGQVVTSCVWTRCVWTSAPLKPAQCHKCHAGHAKWRSISTLNQNTVMPESTQDLDKSLLLRRLSNHENAIV